MKKNIALLLCVTLLLTLCACAGNAGTPTTTAVTTAATTAAATTATTTAVTTAAATTAKATTTAPLATTTAPVTTAATSATTAPTISGSISVPFEETFEFSVMSNYSATLGDKWTVVQQELEKRMNVKIDWRKYVGTAYAEALSVTLASQDLPDLVYGVASDDSWISFGAVIPLEDYMEEYTPNYVSYLSDADMPYITYGDGHIYGIYSIVGFNANMSTMIRRDWLDTLDLEEPVTLEDWDKTLTAFKDGDPNGNGQADEIPMIAPLTPIEYAFGLLGSYIETEYGLIDRYEAPYYMDYVAFCADWYKRGLIDMEYLTRAQNPDANRQLLYNSIAGVYYGAPSELTIITTALRESIPNAVLGAIAPTEGPGGRNVPSRAKFNWPFSISVQAKDVEKLLTYMDWMFTEDGYLLNNFGVEGEHYDMVNGEPILREPYCLTWVDLRDVGMNNVSAIPHYWHVLQFQQLAFAGKSVDTMDEVTYLSYEGYFVTNNEFYYYSLPSSVYQTETYIDGGSELYTKLQELETKVIMGLSPIEELQTMLELYKSQGIDKMVEEANTSWAALNS
ncbi:MAG: hypothetical protein ACOXZM_04490 [Eubacteriales bacterium]